MLQAAKRRKRAVTVIIPPQQHSSEVEAWDEQKCRLHRGHQMATAL